MMYFVFSLLCSCLITFLIVRLDHLHAHLSADHDLAGVQKVHAVPVPRIGGIGIFAGIVCVALWLWMAEWPHREFFLSFLVPSFLVFAIGLLEDLTKRVSVRMRLVITMFAALIGCLLLNATVRTFGIPAIDTLFQINLIALVFTVVAVAGVANAVNLIDGFNGLSGFTCITALLALGAVAYMVGDQAIFVTALVSAGAVAGFLLWNYPNAKIFLGDGGAYLAGFVIAELSVLLHERNPLVSVLFPLLVMIYPVFETLFSIYRRKFVRGQSPGAPDAMHLHQMINKRFVRWRVSHGAGGSIRARGNAMTSPFLWILNLLAVIPAVIFWNNSLMLAGFIVLFAVSYVWIYGSIARFKTPRLLTSLLPLSHSSVSSNHRAAGLAKSKKKILVLMPRFPYPVIGGDRLRIFEVCKALSETFDLTLLTLCATKSEMHYQLPNDGVFKRVERFLLPAWRSWLNCLLAIPSLAPLQVAYYRHGGFRKRAIKLMQEHDAAFAHLIRTGDVIKNAPGIKFLEMTDAISLNYERVKKTKGAPTRDWRTLIYAFEAKRLKRYEQNVVDNFDASFLVSEVDRKYLFSHNPDRLKRTHVSSNGVDTHAFSYQFTQSGKDIVFIGNMSSLQNLDAALYMAKDVLPLIRHQRSDTRLRLIGRIPAEKAAELSKFPGVEVTGEVPDVAQAASTAAVAVCPLRLGAGVQNKVLEYMALGLPTISTSLGLEGFYARPGDDLLVADTTQDLADAVLMLLTDRAEAERLAANGRHYVEEHHSWEAMLYPLVSTIENRLTNRSVTDDQFVDAVSVDIQLENA